MYENRVSIHGVCHYYFVCLGQCFAKQVHVFRGGVGIGGPPIVASLYYKQNTVIVYRVVGQSPSFSSWVRQGGEDG